MVSQHHLPNCHPLKWLLLKRLSKITPKIPRFSPKNSPSKLVQVKLTNRNKYKENPKKVVWLITILAHLSICYLWLIICHLINFPKHGVVFLSIFALASIPLFWCFKMEKDKAQILFVSMLISVFMVGAFAATVAISFFVSEYPNMVHVGVFGICTFSVIGYILFKIAHNVGKSLEIDDEL